MEKRGIDFLYPIWHLIKERRLNGIGLADTDVKVFYTTYINDFKRQLRPNEHSIRTAIDEKLTPGTLSDLDSILKGYLVGSVQFVAPDGSRSPHAMVLDTMRDGKFIFKNTYSAERKFEIEVGHENAPDEFFFVHIQLVLNHLDRMKKRFSKQSRKRKAENS